MRSCILWFALLACRILNIFVTVVSFVTVPLQVVTTAVGGCLVSCTLGLLLLPLSLIWMVFLGLLLATSWLWEQTQVLDDPALGILRPIGVPVLRIPLAVIGIPLALFAQIYASLVPSMGEIEARHVKLVTCWVWPFSIDYWRFCVRLEPVDSPYAEWRYDQLVRAARLARVELLPLADRVAQNWEEGP